MDHPIEFFSYAVVGTPVANIAAIEAPRRFFAPSLAELSRYKWLVGSVDALAGARELDEAYDERLKWLDAGDYDVR